MVISQEYVKTSLEEGSNDSLFTSHYVNEVIPQLPQYQNYSCPKLMDWVNGVDQKPLSQVFDESKHLNEHQTEQQLITPILIALGNSVWSRPSIGRQEMDYCCYDGPSYNDDYTNITAIVESKHYGRIENKYFIKKNNNDDEVYQALNYLRTVNLTLNNQGHDHDVDFIILTDGYRWRVYSKKFTHDATAFERHFIEFDLNAIVHCENTSERDELVKFFGFFFSKESLSGGLLKRQIDSSNLELEVTKELKVQTFTALEYIATGIWRKAYKDRSPLLSAVLSSTYGVDVSLAHENEEERAKLLRVVYDESLVYLLRLLFVLYAEDRNLFDTKKIPKVVKGKGNILSRIIDNNSSIGHITSIESFTVNDDLKLSHIFTLIDASYNGGLFSQYKHPLLYDLDIDDVLFASAIDNLCRVKVKNRIYTVDFSSISEREMGSIYESLLEYKLAIVDKDHTEMPSIVNSRRMRYNVKAGDLYLVNHKGERKATGSYYTPDRIVEHLVRTGLDPKLEAIRKAYPSDFDALFAQTLDIKICDPAMGSGHMLIACYTRIVDFLHQSLEAMAEDNPSSPSWDNDLSFIVRTQVARKCIYGVDLNPIAVELAKLVMWMKVFRPDRPFEFFDYNLACGNSLIGVYSDTAPAKEDTQRELFRSREQVEADILAVLLQNVSHMLDMPRDSVQQVHEVDAYWRTQVRPLQRQIAFFYNIKLVKWLLPDQEKIVDRAYDILIDGIENDVSYVEKILSDDPSIPESVRELAVLDKRITNEFHPLHWRVAFPHIAVRGGFDMVISNPPWDLIKGDHQVFFSDYIDGYADMNAATAKKVAKEYLETHPLVAQQWDEYRKNIEIQNAFYSDSYKWQVAEDENGHRLSSYNNLYKVFIEKIYEILCGGGICGVVVPDNLNIDDGCTGLRHLLLDHATIKELIMFENRKKLFEIHGQYKFDVLVFEKKHPRRNAAFTAGFYWYDPIWLDGHPDDDYIRLNPLNRKDNHVTFSYSVPLIKDISPIRYTIFELRTKYLLDVFIKLNEFPPVGDSSESLYISTYTEFNMTSDSDLFNTDNRGWKLYQGGMIHHYNAHFKEASRFVVQSDGETRLARRRGCDIKHLPDRQFRVAWRLVAQPTDSRSLICTVLPRGVFTGNSLNLVDIHCPSFDEGSQLERNYLTAGINVVLSSFVADFFIRQRIAKNVNAFIVRSLPIPRNIPVIMDIGKLSMPLYDGYDFNAFRSDVTSINDPDERSDRIAELDARVAHLYGLSYEEYQSVLSTFPLVDDSQIERCLIAFNNWTIDLSF